MSYSQHYQGTELKSLSVLKVANVTAVKLGTNSPNRITVIIKLYKQGKSFGKL